MLFKQQINRAFGVLVKQNNLCESINHLGLSAMMQAIFTFFFRFVYNRGENIMGRLLIMKNNLQLRLKTIPSSALNFLFHVSRNLEETDF